MKEFKAGDKVYYPTKSTKIYTLLKRDVGDGYGLQIKDIGVTEIFDEEGDGILETRLPALIHATQRNYELLSELYPEYIFEKPTLRGTELAKKLCERGEKFWAVVGFKPEYDPNNLVAIYCIAKYYANTNYPFHTVDGEDFKYAFPVNVINGKVVEREE